MRAKKSERLLPASVKICGKRIKIKIKDIDSNHGEYVHDEATIYLSNDPRHEKDQWASLLHEIIHAVLTISGVSEVLGIEKEEAVCRSIENVASILKLKV
jgi:Zn-dependent peptidase ImmA (M78 family)